MPILNIKMPMTLNIASKVKNTTLTHNVKKSRLITGIIVKQEDGYYCKVNLKGDKIYPDYALFKLSEDSLNIKGKTTLYKDDGKQLFIWMRDKTQSESNSGINDVWSTVVDKVIVTGYVIKNKTGVEFLIKETHGRNGKINDYKNIDHKAPLFKDGNTESTG